MGSCFSENIGVRLTRLKFDALINPYGILYNPLSISKALSEIMACKHYTLDNLVYHGGIYHSMMHHSQFSSSDKDAVLCRINDNIVSAHDCLENADWLVLTFGTSYVYHYHDEVVSNCHKLPEKEFVRRFCEYRTMLDAYTGLLDRLFAQNSRLKLLLTVSPIRHLRDGLHQNMLSKSNLILFVEALMQRYPHKIFYFPSYELMMDELRDYRFYAEDMLHPSKVAVDYIWEKFTAMFMDDKTLGVMHKCENIARMIEHKPFDSTSAAYHSFLTKLADDIAKLTSDYPGLDFSNELNNISQLLNNYGS